MENVEEVISINNIHYLLFRHKSDTKGVFILNYFNFTYWYDFMDDECTMEIDVLNFIRRKQINYFCNGYKQLL